MTSSALPAEKDGREPRGVVIDAAPGFFDLGIKTLWQQREVVYFLAWRDIKVRYRQTYIGFGWAVIQPLVSMVIFAAVFGRWARIPSDGVPYALFAYAALLPWTFLSSSVIQMSFSLVTNAGLIGKIRLPRLALPVASLLTFLVDFGVALLLFFPLMVYYRFTPGPQILLLPVLLGMLAATCLGLGAWAAAAAARYHDVQYAFRSVFQLWLYATPVIYPLSLVPGKYAPLVKLNPMTGIVEGFRSVLLGRPLVLDALAVSAAFSAGALYFGLRRFRKIESTLADIL